MLNSNRVKALAITKLAAATLAVSLVALGSASPGYAQPSYEHGAMNTGRHMVRHRDQTASHRSGWEAFGMTAQPGFGDPNSPEATGGGSLGYNRKLLEY